MVKDIVLTLRLDNITIKELDGFPLGLVKRNIKFLAQLPLLEVYPLYEKSGELDYKKGHRSIGVKADPNRPLEEPLYVVIDYAYVKGSDNDFDDVGMRIYTHKEVDELRNPPRDPKIRGVEILDD